MRQTHLDNRIERRFKNEGQLQLMSLKGRIRGKEKTIGLRKKSDEKIKLQRAQGGCPGTIRRRRTWQAAKSHGEPQAGFDPWISEWGNPVSEEGITVR